MAVSNEELLLKIQDFFESCRITGEEMPMHGAKVCSFPGAGSVRDWFIPRDAESVYGRHGWLVIDEEFAVFQGCSSVLCRLRLPPFVCPGNLFDMKFIFIDYFGLMLGGPSFWLFSVFFGY